ncbi:MAG: glycosyltransferase [Synergistaceae bacterium]|jgi:glycosyltransferase involved in cell wall biosynthesis|nr:glycosyltransferase [Synergistaceae bacterium]
MKLSLLCSDLRFGGIQRVVRILARELAAKDDLSVDLAVLHEGGEFMSLNSPAVNVVDLDCTSQPLALLTPFSRLASYFRAAKPDVVISFGHSTNCLASWAKLLRGFDFRLVVSERNVFGTRMASDSKFHRLRRIMRARYLYRQADRCVCVSNVVADELVDLGVVPREKTVVIYNPVQDPSSSAEMCAPVDHPWFCGSASPERPIIMSAGRLHKLKGLDTLVTAFSRLRHNSNVDARLVILGDGPDRGRLEVLAKELGLRENTFFAGYVPNIYAYMERASVFVLSSKYEGLPNVLIEAIACGVNVVSTDCPSGPREILADGKWGRLVPIGDADAMAEAISETLRRPLSSEELKKRASYFSTERAVNAYYDVIRKSFPDGVRQAL